MDWFEPAEGPLGESIWFQRKTELERTVAKKETPAFCSVDESVTVSFFSESGFTSTRTKLE